MLSFRTRLGRRDEIQGQYVESALSPSVANMRLFVLGSGSSGNAVLVESGGSRVLVDAGLGPRSCVKRLLALGVELFPRGVDAIVVTHEHADHAAHLVSLGKALRCPIVLHEGVKAPSSRLRFPVLPLSPSANVTVGDLVIEAHHLPHDAPNVAVRISSADGAFGYATDLGHVPKGLDAFLAATDVVMLEANHCAKRLATGPYADRLKRRITGGFGHLSNDETGLLVRAMGAFGDPLVALCHLSLVNNEPDVAMMQVSAHAPKARLTVLEHGSPEELRVARVARRGVVQLAFGF